MPPTPLTPDPSSPSARDRVLHAMVGVASWEELQINRRRMSIAYTIAAFLVPAFAVFDFGFVAIDPGWNLQAILAIRLFVTPILMLAALRTRRRDITARELDAWIL